MTGPEHYTEAERLIAGAHAKAKEADVYGMLLAEAQVHATLALAAATAMAAYRGADEDRGTMPSVDSHAWDQVAGVSPL